jgi:hypothetical protein
LKLQLLGAVIPIVDFLQWIHHRRVNREDRVEQMRKSNSVGLRHQPEQVAISVECPWAAKLDDLDSSLVVPVE